MAAHLFLVAGDLGWQRRRNPMPPAAGLTAALDDPGTDLQAVLVERVVPLPHGGGHIRKASQFQGNETTRPKMIEETVRADRRVAYLRLHIHLSELRNAPTSATRIGGRDLTPPGGSPTGHRPARRLHPRVDRSPNPRRAARRTAGPGGVPDLRRQDVRRSRRPHRVPDPAGLRPAGRHHRGHRPGPAGPQPDVHRQHGQRPGPARDLRPHPARVDRHEHLGRPDARRAVRQPGRVRAGTGRRAGPGSRQAAAARGKLSGRPRKLPADKVALALRMRAAGESAPTIAQALGVSRATLYRALERASA